MLAWRASAAHRVGLLELNLAHALFLLHPAVLEPDFHLSLVQSQGGGDLDATGSGEVLVEVELLLQLRQLFVGEVGPPGPRGHRRARARLPVSAGALLPAARARGAAILGTVLVVAGFRRCRQIRKRCSF